MNRLSEPLHVLSGFWKDEKRTQCALHLLYAIMIGVAAMLLCYRARTLPMYYPGPGDFNWALDTATALMQGKDPYAFEPSSLKVPYPLPVALFGAPFIALPKPLAAAIFLAHRLVCWRMASSNPVNRGAWWFLRHFPISMR